MSDVEAMLYRMRRTSQSIQIDHQAWIASTAVLVLINPPIRNCLIAAARCPYQQPGQNPLPQQQWLLIAFTENVTGSWVIANGNRLGSYARCPQRNKIYSGSPAAGCRTKFKETCGVL